MCVCVYIYIFDYFTKHGKIKLIYGCYQTSFYIAVIKCHVRKTYFKMEHYMRG